MELSDLKKLTAKLPGRPGVYLFLGERAVPLYIGKASNLKSRVSAYPKSEDARIRTMLENARTLNFKTTDTDIEALILESQLVRRHKPKFNVMLRDDKNYFYVAVTDEEFPQFFLTHQLHNKKIKKKIREYIGPFTDGVPLKTTLSFLRRLFPYCTCKQKHHVRCLNAHIGKCLGFCCLKNNEQFTTADKRQYAKNVSATKDILSGRRDTLIKKMEKEMKAFGENRRFEEALALKQKIGRVRRVFQNARIIRRQTSKSGVLEQLRQALDLPKVPVRIEGYDISNIQGHHPTGSMSVFTDGRPDKNEYRKFNIKSVVGSNDVAMLKEVLARRLNHPEWTRPDLIIVDGGKGQLNAVQRTLIEKSHDIPLIALTKNDRHRGDHIYVSGDKEPVALRQLPEQVKNLILHIDSEAHRFAISHYRTRHRRSIRPKGGTVAN